MKHILLIATIGIALLSCKDTKKENNDQEPQTVAFKIKSTSFNEGDSIPAKYSCKISTSSSPQLNWTKPKNKAMSYVMVMNDPDAAQVVGYTYQHWLLYDIPESASVIEEANNPNGAIPAGTLRGTTSSNNTIYNGPCPPAGQKHTYHFRLYAIDKATLGLAAGANISQLTAAMKGHVSDSTEFTATFMK